MAQKKTQQEYVEELSITNPNTELIDTYINARTPVLHRCKRHNEIWAISPSNALKGQGCSECHYEKIRDKTVKSYNTYVAEASIKNPDIEVVGLYINSHTPISHRCKLCNRVWDACPSDILAGKGCKVCKDKKNADLRRKTKEQYIGDLNLVNPNIVIDDEYINTDTAVYHKCKICNHRWRIKPNHTLSGHSCPICNQSRGEREISLWLDKNNFDYIQQYKFQDCRDKLPLPFDFYIPLYNMCIEYDGEQHFKPKDWFGGIDALKILQYHDNIKTNYCANNNIQLLRISYKQDTIEELEKFFVNLNTVT